MGIYASETKQFYSNLSNQGGSDKVQGWRGLNTASVLVSAITIAR